MSSRWFFLVRSVDEHKDDEQSSWSSSLLVFAFDDQQQQFIRVVERMILAGLVIVTVLIAVLRRRRRRRDESQQQPITTPSNINNPYHHHDAPLRPRFDSFGSIGGGAGVAAAAAAPSNRTAAATATATTLLRKRFFTGGSVDAGRLNKRWSLSSTVIEDFPEMIEGFQYSFSWETGGILRPNVQNVAAYYYFGPSRQSLQYETWTPPPSWTEASRQVVLPHASDVKSSLLREISLTCLSSEESTLTIQQQQHAAAAASRTKQQQKEKSQLVLPVNMVSTHVHTPVQGGVMDIYVKKESSTTEEQQQQQEGCCWSMEHTFASASSAAQFQVDLLSLQTFGPSLYHMYQALEIVHQGSMAYAGKEYVLHDTNTLNDDHDHDHDANNNNNDNNLSDAPSGIAWDDVMRCLGCAIPSIRLQLEALWWSHATDAISSGNANTGASPSSRPKDGGNKDTTTTATSGDPPDTSAAANDTNNTYLLEQDYVNKRLLLGPIDFFRLFVPRLAETAVPQDQCSKDRMERLLRWRKRVAHASVLVQAYTKAHQVANKGWQLLRPPPPSPEQYRKRRLAFDENLDNARWDTVAKNEYYEATVSRDVICQVRGLDSLKKQPWWSCGLDHVETTMSQAQGYTLVGMQSVKYQADNNNNNNNKSCPFRPDRDPVLALSSLRELIEENPDLDFFIVTVYSGLEEDHCVGTVMVFVRSLPKGMDPSFDTVVNNYTNGSKDVRDRKLEVIFQVAVHADGISWKAWFTLLLLSFFTRFSLRDDVHVPQQTTFSGDRIAAPAMRTSGWGDTYHFGGKLQSDMSLPSNYVAHSVEFDTRKWTNVVTRILVGYMHRGGFARDVVDIVFVLAGHESEELPERVLGTVRNVHSLPRDMGLSPNYVTTNELESDDKFEDAVAHQESAERKIGASNFQNFVSDTVSACVAPFAQAFSGQAEEDNADARLQEIPEDSSRQDSQATIVAATDPLEKAVNEMVGILENIEVPVRRDTLPSYYVTSSRQAPLSLLNTGESTGRDDLVKVPILSRVSRSDILRYFLATGCSHRRTAIRIIESTAWHGLTFPIDTKACRIELQNGQFFQQGRDKHGCPVFYFRNMCLGPWRRDENAVVAAALHRLETSLKRLREEDDDIQFTVIVVMGKPHRTRQKKSKTEALVVPDESGDLAKDANDESMESNEHNDDLSDKGNDDESEGEYSYETAVPPGLMNNPRIDPDEHWHVHTSENVVRCLIDLLMAHYPERLRKALVVVGHGNTAYTRTAVGGLMRLAKYVPSSRTRSKVRFLIRYSDLREYVDKDQLVTLVGGPNGINPKAFECE